MASTVFRLFTRTMASTNRLEIKHVTVIGGGQMGSGIAQTAATFGYDVTVVEVNSAALDKAKEIIRKNLQKVAIKKFKDSEADQRTFLHETFNRITGTIDMSAAVAKTDLVIEAILENIKVKQDLFASIDKVAPAHTIFASNTSSLSIKEIASATTRADRFGGLHFFIPVPIMKLLEVVRTDELSADSFTKLKTFGESIGKVCIECKDTPGYVVNRLLVPYVLEAIKLLERGDASAKDIDIAMKLGAGYVIGPIELSDYIGLDTLHQILQGWNEKFPDNPLFRPIPLLDKLVKEGKFGVKTGEGFYTYES